MILAHTTRSQVNEPVGQSGRQIAARSHVDTYFGQGLPGKIYLEAVFGGVEGENPWLNKVRIQSMLTKLRYKNVTHNG